MSDRSEHNSVLAPFRLPLFRWLWTANVLTTIGGYINDVGAAWLMTSLSPSPFMVSLIQVAANAPFFLLARARKAMKLDVLLATATALSGAVEAAIGGVRSFPILCGVMLLAGVAWVTVMSSLNNAAQSILPPWVRSRAMSAYLMVFFGAMTAGSLLWGAIATRVGAPPAITLAACGTFATLALIPRFRVMDHKQVDLTPSLHWPAPMVVHPPSDDRGPVLVTVEYRVDPANAEQFIRSMQRLRRERMRTGSFRWGLFNDAADPARYIEAFLSESWAEHVRQHGRVTAADREIEDAVNAFHLGPEKPVIRHLIHSDMNAFHGERKLT